MLKCRDIAEQGMPEGDLSLWRRWRFYLHLKMCKHCSRLFKHLQITRRLAAGIGVVETPAEEADRVVKHVQRRLQTKTK